jgi:hypothetical protein
MNLINGSGTLLVIQAHQQTASETFTRFRSDSPLTSSWLCYHRITKVVPEPINGAFVPDNLSISA